MSADENQGDCETSDAAPTPTALCALESSEQKVSVPEAPNEMEGSTIFAKGKRTEAHRKESIEFLKWSASQALDNARLADQKAYYILAADGLAVGFVFTRIEAALRDNRGPLFWGWTFAGATALTLVVGIVVCGACLWPRVTRMGVSSPENGKNGARKEGLDKKLVQWDGNDDGSDFEAAMGKKLQEETYDDFLANRERALLWISQMRLRSITKKFSKVKIALGVSAVGWFLALVTFSLLLRR